MECIMLWQLSIILLQGVQLGLRMPNIFQNRASRNSDYQKGLSILSIFHILSFSTVTAAAIGKADPYKWNALNFVLEPTFTIAQRNSPAWLHCLVEGNITPTIIWSKDGTPLSLTNNSNLNLMQNGTLHIVSVNDPPDSGEYRCIASSPAIGKIVSSKAKLITAGMPKFESVPRNLSVYEGERAHFQCSLVDQYLAEIMWYKDGGRLHLDSRMTILHSGSLEIEKARLQDEGEYYCMAAVRDKTKFSRKAILKVHEALALREPSPPMFIVKPSALEARIGENITLDCAANGYPEPSIVWLRDGSLVDMQNLDSRYVYYGPTRSLLISDVQEEDGGTYMCRAENRLDSIDAVATVQVLVEPRFLVKPENMISYEREDIEFTCKTYGLPKPDIKWFKDGEEIKGGEYFQITGDTNLKIFGLIPEDAGMYQCFTSNSAGETQASAQLVVRKTGKSAKPATKDERKIPSSPRHVHLVVSSNRYVTLSWHEPEKNNENIVGYSLYYRKDGSHRERVQNISASSSVGELDVYKTHVGQLSSGSTYLVRVVAHTSDGSVGESSEEIRVITSPDLDLPDPPENLEAKAISSTAIYISWASPKPKNTPVTGFKLYYMEVGSAEEHEIDITITSHTLNSLEEFTEYSIWLVAVNANGIGDATHEVTARTFSDVPSKEPQNVTAEAVSSKSLILRWEPPPAKDQNGIITGYKIRFKQRGNPGSTTKTTDGNRRLYALTDLQKSTQYSLKLSAMTVNGSGPTTTWILAKTFSNDLDENRVPEIPASLTAIPNRDSIEVHWLPPASQDVMVRGYTIGWGRGIPDVFTKLVESKQRSYIIQKLEPNSEYVISLRGWNNQGNGPIIYEQVRTLSWKKEPISSLTPPVGLKTEVLTPFTISVQWTDTTLNRNQFIGNRGHYSIRYTTFASASSSTPKYKYKNVSDVTALIDNLKPATMYEFSVKAVKGTRESMWSLVVNNKTSEARPSSPPRDITIVPTSSDPTKVAFNWHPPKQSNGKITGYLVFYTTDPKSDWALEEADGDRMSTTLRHLTPKTLYYYKMQAKNSKGLGPFSSMDNFTSLPALLPVSTSPQGMIVPQSGLVMLIIGGVVGVMTFIIIIVGFLCYFKRNRATPQNNLNTLDKGTKVEVKPPDLWIHHDHLELKNLDKNRGGSPTHLADIQHAGPDFEPDDKNTYTSTSTLDRRTPYQSTYLPVVGGSTSSSVYSDGTLGKPGYALLQYATATANQECSSPQENPYLINPNSTLGSSDGSSTLGKRLGNPLRSFSVPAPPQSAPTTPHTKHLIGCESDSLYYNHAPLLPKASTSPLKKVHNPVPICLPSLSGGGSSGRRAYHIARVESLPEREEMNNELGRGYSTEELSQEMANLEGLMKDLSAITANQFKC